MALGFKSNTLAKVLILTIVEAGEYFNRRNIGHISSI